MTICLLKFMELCNVSMLILAQNTLVYSERKKDFKHTIPKDVWNFIHTQRFTFSIVLSFSENLLKMLCQWYLLHTKGQKYTEILTVLEGFMSVVALLHAHEILLKGKTILASVVECMKKGFTATIPLYIRGYFVKRCIYV